ncbi:MAG: hypothetical protein NVSMB27_42480 [Ktedonobacteraceae bacterium]
MTMFPQAIGPIPAETARIARAANPKGTLLQYVEDLTDRQAAEAVRTRLDWKYLLGLELGDAGFDASVLVEFRQRLLTQGAEERLLNKLLLVCRQRGWLKAGGKMRTDATHVLAAVRSLHHLETVGETLRAVVEELAEVAPDWLLSWMAEEWFKRYEGRMDSRRLPKKEQERRTMACCCSRRWNKLEPQPPRGNWRVCRCCGRSGRSITTNARDRSW